MNSSKKLSASSAKLDPDVFESTEVGVKWDFTPDLSLTASYFDSEQIQAVTDSDTGENAEIVGMTVDGFELELKGQLTDNLYLAFGLSNLDGKTSSGGLPREILNTADHSMQFGSHLTMLVTQLVLPIKVNQQLQITSQAMYYPNTQEWMWSHGEDCQRTQ